MVSPSAPSVNRGNSPPGCKKHKKVYLRDQKMSSWWIELTVSPGLEK